MTKVDLGETHFTIRRTASGLWIELIGPEGHAEITVSESCVRNNMRVFDKIRHARFIPGTAAILAYAAKLEKAIKEELAKPPQ